MTCPYARNDAAYVLGALTPEERHQYEEHLHDCQTCTGAVREVAGLPGLLARLSVDRVLAMDAKGSPSAQPAMPPVPETLLPRLLRQVRRDRRRARWRVAVVAGVAAAAVAVAGTATVEQMSRPNPPTVSRTVALASVGNRSVWGTVQLIPWDWGTTVRITCHTEKAAAKAGDVYSLYAIDRAGTEYLVSSWRSSPEREDVTVPGGIPLKPEDLVSFRVRDDHRAVVMQGP